MGITDTMSGAGSITRGGNDTRGHHSASIFSNNIISATSASEENRITGGASTRGSMQHLMNNPSSSSSDRNNHERQQPNFRGHIVRLNSIEPNTVMFNTKVGIEYIILQSRNYISHLEDILSKNIFLYPLGLSNIG